MKTILFVDDDANIRQGLKRMLYSMHLDWELEFSDNGINALQLLKQRQFDAIICDMRMPGISGLDVLKVVSEQYPNTIRFVLSGMTDKETALNVTRYAHQFLVKPCDASVLVQALQRAFSRGSLIEGEQLKKLISRLEKLPSLPSLYMDVMEEIRSPNVALERIGAIIERDPSMSAKILQLVNSAFFGMKQNVVSPTQAVTLLGVDVIKDLLLSINVFAQFNPGLLKRLGIGSLWEHSTNVSAFAKTIMKQEDQNKTGQNFAFTAGLLHDIGKLVLAENLSSEYLSALGISKRKNIPLFKAERETFAADHAQVGAYLLGIWGLPEAVIEGVAYHHSPHESPTSTFSIVSAVYAANFIDHKLNPRKWSIKNEQIDEGYLGKISMIDHFSAWSESCAALQHGQAVKQTQDGKA